MDTRGSGLAATYQNTTLIYNPFAGALRRDPSFLDRTIQFLARSGYRVHPLATTGPNTAGRLTRRRIDEGADLIIAAGGDGTINEVINGMAGTQVPLGILPCGTANVLANEMSLPVGFPAAPEALTSCVPVRIALGLVRATDAPPRYFLLMAGVGFDAQVVYEVSAGLKNRLGKVSYWFSGFSQFGRRLVQFDTRFNGKSLKCSFALASRVRNYGGDFEIATWVTLLDNCFELVLFEGEYASRYLLYLMGLLTGRLAKTKGVTVSGAERAEFWAPPESRVRLQIDGECVGRLPATIEIVPDALTLLVPASYLERANKRAWTTSPIASPA